MADRTRFPLAGIEGLWPEGTVVSTVLKATNNTNQKYTFFAWNIALALAVDEISFGAFDGASQSQAKAAVLVVQANASGDDTLTGIPQGGYKTVQQAAAFKTPIVRKLLADPSNGADIFVKPVGLNSINREDTSVPYVSREKITQQSTICFVMENLQNATTQVEFYFKGFPLVPALEQLAYANPEG